MILLDSDVLAIYHFFTHDSRYQATRDCIDTFCKDDVALTIYNLLELAGILSSAGKADLGKKIVTKYLNAGDMRVLFPRKGYISGDVFWEEYCSGIMDVIARGIRYGDAKIIWVAELYDVSMIITWNVRHFTGKTSIPIKTPANVNELRIE